MAFSFFSKTTSGANWKNLTTPEQLQDIETASFSTPQVIFKHSTRCSISSMAKNRVEQGFSELEKLADIWYLDLISLRAISNTIAEKWNIEHESPQVIVIKNGNAIYHASHNMIEAKELETVLTNIRTNEQ